jgi:hypothetical protein
MPWHSLLDQKVVDIDQKVVTIFIIALDQRATVYMRVKQSATRRHHTCTLPMRAATYELQRQGRIQKDIKHRTIPWSCDGDAHQRQ